MYSKRDLHDLSTTELSNLILEKVKTLADLEPESADYKDIWGQVKDINGIINSRMHSQEAWDGQGLELANWQFSNSETEE